MPLFGLSLSDVEKMASKSDVQGLIKATAYKKDYIVRSHAIDALGNTRDSRAVAALAIALYDQDPIVRWHVPEALGKIGNPQARDVLITALKDPDETVQWSTMVALRAIGDEKAIDALIVMLKNQDTTLRRRAATVLGGINNKRVGDALTALLDDPVLDVRLEAASALIKIGGDHRTEGLLVRLTHPDPKIRVETVKALSGIEDMWVITALISSLQDNDWSVRREATNALGKTGDPNAIDSLKGALLDQEPVVRSGAVYALDKINDIRAIDALILALEDSTEYVWSTAANALEKKESDRSHILPILYKMLENQETLGSKKVGIAQVIHKLKPDADKFPLLVRALLENDEDTANYIRLAIAEIGDLDTAANESAPQLIEAWKRTRSHLRFFLETLKKMGVPPPPETIDYIIRDLFKDRKSTNLLIDALFEMVPNSALTEEYIHCAEQASSLSPGCAVTKLCAVNTPISSNLLHLVMEKKDEEVFAGGTDDGCVEYETIRFNTERDQAHNELVKRGYPAYQPEAYYKKPSS